jgi:K+-sensing histidine kinase KdpD
MSAEQYRLMIENVQLAMSLGANVVTQESEDVVGTVIDFANKEHIGLLVVGQPSRRGFGVITDRPLIAVGDS